MSLYAFRSFPAPLPPVSSVTPLEAEQFAWELRLDPQRPQVNFVLDGIHHGFCPSQKLKSAKKNKPSATQHASVIDTYLGNEVSLGRVPQARSIPLPCPALPNLQISSFGHSSDEFTLHYITVDQIIRLVSRLGERGSHC